MDKYKHMMKTGIKNPRKVVPFLKFKYRRFISKKLASFYRNVSIFYNSRRGIGTNVFEKEWDILIILDTCRVDALQEVAPEYDFITDIESYWSVGGHSAEWVAKTFDRDYDHIISDTAYISANPNLENVLSNRLKEHWKNEKKTDINRLDRYGSWDFVDKHELGKYEDLWRYSGEDYKYCPPRYVTDRGITISREENHDRIILHYMPPHTPYLNHIIPKNSALREFPDSSFAYLMKTSDKESVFEAYLNMLRWVLDDVEILINNIGDKKIAITADHGEAFGEYMIYKHRAGSLHPHIRRVPWVETKGDDSGFYEPSFSPDQISEDNEQSVEESLRALGYI